MTECKHPDVAYGERFRQWECIHCGQAAHPPLLEAPLPLDLARRALVRRARELVKDK